MAVDAFIKFEITNGTKVEGESQDSKHLGEIELKDFSFGVENPTTIGSATGGAGAGKVKFNAFAIKKTTDKSSPSLFINCAAGSHYDTVTLTCRKAGKDPQDYLKFVFSTVFTTKVDWSGPGDLGAEETVAFVYGKVVINYAPQNKDGSLGGFSKTGWDQIKNQKV